MTDGVVTTKECGTCGYVFERYFYHNGDFAHDWEPRKHQRICPTCGGPVFVVKTTHPGEEL